MKNDLALSIIIPAYNEEEVITSIIQEIQAILHKEGVENEIIVINDGSTDKTGELAAQEKVKLINNPVSAGYGHAIDTGIQAAKYEYIVTIDADGSYRPEDIVRLLPHMKSFDMVIGARSGKEYRGTFFKYPARLLFLKLAEFTAGVKIPDVNSGLRIFRKTAYQKIPSALVCHGFSHSTTMTIAFILNYFFVTFIPIEYRARIGHSKIRYVRDTLRSLQGIVRTILYYNPFKLVLLLTSVPLLVGLVAFLNYCWTLSRVALLAGLLSLYVIIICLIMGFWLEQSGLFQRSK